VRDAATGDAIISDVGIALTDARVDKVLSKFQSLNIVGNVSTDRPITAILPNAQFPGLV
jgi:hypothetical protein